MFSIPRVIIATVLLFNASACADLAGEDEADVSCPPIAESCPDGCYELTAREYDRERNCMMSTWEVLGCSESGIHTADLVCLEADGRDADYIGSSSHVNTAWRLCELSDGALSPCG
ncbi:MAG: hypothetical protein ACQEVA_21495 [Myxococcota bacterium]